jgi:hypothetical protein
VVQRVSPSASQASGNPGTPSNAAAMESALASQAGPLGAASSDPPSADGDAVPSPIVVILLILGVVGIGLAYFAVRGPSSRSGSR